jgi:hypothetical protein
MKLNELIGINENAFNNCKLHFATGPTDWNEALKAFVKGDFKEWQEYQAKKNFERKFIVSLIAYKGNDWLFAGVYKPISVKWLSEQKYWKYETELTEFGQDFIGRAIIEYKRTFRQSYTYFENYSQELNVVEILRKKCGVPTFPGYENTSIDFDFLKLIIDLNEPSWKSALSSIQGIYLITDGSTGKQYIGSATGNENLWQRWATYSENGHGGNTELIKIIAQNKEYASNFRFTILEIQRNNIDSADIIKRENYWKEALRTRKFGYNNN